MPVRGVKNEGRNDTVNARGTLICMVQICYYLPLVNAETRTKYKLKFDFTDIASLVFNVNNSVLLRSDIVNMHKLSRIVQSCFCKSLKRVKQLFTATTTGPRVYVFWPAARPPLPCFMSANLGRVALSLRHSCRQ